MKQELIIERLAYGGEGISFIDGKVCFVDGALPGEKVVARIKQDKKKFLRAKVSQVLTASPHRVAPPCPYIQECGGCQYQHVQYAEELRWKENQVREHLQRNLKIDPVLIQPVVGSSKDYGYRSSVTLHKIPKKGTADANAGFVARDNQSIIPVNQCLLAEEKLSAVFQKHHSFKNDDETITFRLSKDGKIFSNQDEDLFEIQIGGETLFTHPKGFFQNNLEITAAIANKLKQWIQHSNPGIFVDLYAGAGTFTLLSAQEVPLLVCAEENRYSLKALEKNVAARNLTVTVLEGKAEAIFPAWLKETKSEKAFVFLDPPRKGLSPKLADFLSEQTGFSGLAYLSCHLGSFTRDLAIILKNTKYRIKEIIPYDMFPRTKHIEILTLLEKAN